MSSMLTEIQRMAFLTTVSLVQMPTTRPTMPLGAPQSRQWYFNLRYAENAT